MHRQYQSVAWLLTIATVTWCSATRAEDAPHRGARLLMVTQSGGYQHASVTRSADRLSPAEMAITELGVTSNVFRADCTQNVVKDLTKERLDTYDIVLFYTTGGKDQLPIPPDVRDYLCTEWIKQKGHGFIGTHSAADTYADYPPYWEMLGGTFESHPWNSHETVTIAVHDAHHPASKPWGSSFIIQDEIYKFKNWQPEKVRVLMSLDMAQTHHKEPYHVPILWVKEYAEGRVMHMSLGHNEAVWAHPTYRASLLGGIRWMLGYESADATPNPEVSANEDLKAKQIHAASPK